MPEIFSLPRVKVCGLTRAEDVTVAVEAGADAVGFVAWEGSPRHVAPERVAALVEGLPAGVRSVGVMVEANPHQGVAWAESAGVGALQLCGDQNPLDWEGFPLPLLRRIGVEEGAAELMDAWSEVAAGFVLDHPSSPGGSGREVGTSLAASLAGQAPCLLAGGLDHDRVTRAVRKIRPGGVDASSGLEREPGIKDSEKVAAFVTRALEALEALDSLETMESFEPLEDLEG